MEKNNFDNMSEAELDKVLFSNTEEFDDNIDFDKLEEKKEDNSKTTKNGASKMSHFNPSYNNIINVVKKPAFHITIDGQNLLIKIKTDYDEEMLKIIRNVFKGSSFDNNEKCHVISYNAINRNKIQTLIDIVDETIVGNDLNMEDLFDFQLNVIQPKKVEKKKISIADQLGEQLKSIDEVKKEQKSVKEGQYIAKDEEGGELAVDAGGKVSIYSQKETHKQTIEEVSWELMKDRIFISSLNYSVYAYNEDKGCYEVSENKNIGIKHIISRILVKNNLSSYNKPSHLKSIEEHVKTQAYAFKKVSYFNNKFIAVKLNNSTTLDKALIYVDYKDNGTRAFRVIECSELVETNVFAEVELNAELIKNDKGEVWTGESLENNRFFYEFKTDKNSDFYKLFTNSLFASEAFEKIAKMFLGMFLTSEKPQKAMFFAGEGNDGKSVLFSMLKLLFPSVAVDFKINLGKGDASRFQYSVLKDKKIGLVSEIKEDGFDHMFFKNITGDDGAKTEAKGVDLFNLDSKNLFIFIAMNYGDIFRIPNMDKAMRRRLLFVKCEASKRVILNFAKKLMDGFFFEEEKREVSAQRLEFFHWLMEGALESLNSDAFNDSEVKAEKYGQDVFDFYESMIEKMSPRAEFFREYEIELLDNGRGATLADIYDYYEKWTVIEKATKLGNIGFKNELVRHIHLKFGIKIDITNVEFRAQVGNARKRVLPVTIRGAKIDLHTLEFPKNLIKAGILTNEEFKEKFELPIEKVENKDDLFGDIVNGKPEEQAIFNNYEDEIRLKEIEKQKILDEEEELCRELEMELKAKQDKLISIRR